MTAFTVAQIAGWAGGRVVAGDPAAPVSGFAWDSRLVAPGQCFAALPGARVDGHAYLDAAFAAGAACALVSRDVPAPPGGGALVRVQDTLLALGTLAARHRARFDLPVVGVTGSVGKTTTKELVWSVLSRRWRTFKTTGNLNSEVGLPVALLNELDGSYGAAVLEMGMRGLGEIAYLVSIARPRVAVVTNVLTSHLEFLGSRENIARAKGELVAGLPPEGVAVLNGDDDFAADLARLAPGPVIWCSLAGAPGPRFVTLRDRRPEGDAGQAFTLVTDAGSVACHLPAPGLHLARGALAAAGAGLALGLTLDQIAAGLQAYAPAGARLRIVDVGGVRILDDTYNAAPASVQAALAVLAELGAGRPGKRVAVLGDMYELGPATEAGHREVGAAAATAADLLVAVGEYARWYAEGAAAAGMRAVHHVAGNPAALDLLQGRLDPGDTVLVKGSRGMRMEEIVSALENQLPRLS